MQTRIDFPEDPGLKKDRPQPTLLYETVRDWAADSRPERTFFVRDGQAAWATGLRLGDGLHYLRTIGNRELCLMALLYQHRYLTAAQIGTLLFPSLRAAQAKLNAMAVQDGLLERWWQLQPMKFHVRRQSSVFLLAQKGAVLLAELLRDDRSGYLQAARQASEYCHHPHHTLEANGFFVGLATESASLSDQGLYHWLGEATMRRKYVRDGGNLAPDGWGLYLTPERDVALNLEWDRSTESAQQLKPKIEGYIYNCPTWEQVVFVAPSLGRENTIRGVLNKTLPDQAMGRFWTSNTEQIEQKGHLGAIWLQAGPEPGPRRPLVDLPGGRPDVERPIHDCVGKPGWYEVRPGGGEAA